MQVLEPILLLEYPSKLAEYGVMTVDIKCRRKSSRALLLKRIIDFIFPLKPNRCSSAKKALEQVQLLKETAIKNPDEYYDVEDLLYYLDLIITEIKKDIALDLASRNL